MKPTRFLPSLALILVLGSTSADTITFTHEGKGSGTLNGIVFGPTSIILTGVGETADRQPLGFGYWIDHGTSTADIAGVGIVAITSGTRTFVNNGGSVGFSRAGGDGTDLFNGPFDPVFKTWDMLSGIGPVFGQGSFVQWTSAPVTTTGGILVINSAITSIVFTATISADCYPDCEGDGDLDIFDFFCFQSAHANGENYADCEGDGDLDLFDVLCFQGAYADGCP